MPLLSPASMLTSARTVWQVHLALARKVWRSRQQLTAAKVILICLWNFFDYTSSMARPQKDSRLRMDFDLRIPVTAEQKRLIQGAVADEPDGLAAWARQILLAAAADKLAAREEAGTK